MSVLIDSNFDGGNIVRLQSESEAVIRLAIEPDAGGEFLQWFFFRVTAPRGNRYQLRIENAGQSAYPRGWEDYRVVVSNDGDHWYRLPTQYDGTTLQFDLTVDSNVTWVAYFAPYTLHQHHQLIGRCTVNESVQCMVPGHSVDGRSIDCLVVGHEQMPLKIWAIARQHPGESMAQWWMQGYLERLCSRHDPVVRELLKQAVFYVVPNMNPDGSYRGYLRTNAAGRNLNREWSDPSADHSPEVFHVRNLMLERGVDFCLDVHGDEALPYNFVAGTEGTASWDERRATLQDLFKQQLQRINPDFQTEFGYPRTPAGRANYGICSNYVAEQFDCLALTLEMPFKDTVQNPDANEGWSPNRSAGLGSSCVDAIYRIVEKL
ncbi:MAG: M14-type cytosolic carboxypeptidase [Pseudomonadota bacterium]